MRDLERCRKVVHGDRRNLETWQWPPVSWSSCQSQAQRQPFLGLGSDYGVASAADADQAVADLARTGTFLPNPTFSNLISSKPSLTVAFTPSGSISAGRPTTRKMCLVCRSE